MRLNRSFTSGTISIKHYLRAFYTLLLLPFFLRAIRGGDPCYFSDGHTVQNGNVNWSISWLNVSRWWGVSPYSRIARRCSRVG